MLYYSSKRVIINRAKKLRHIFTPKLNIFEQRLLILHENLPCTFYHGLKIHLCCRCALVRNSQSRRFCFFPVMKELFV